jgi:hypothetical protein
MLAVHFHRETPAPEGTLNEVMSGLFDSHSDVVLYNLTIISPLKITGVLHTTPYMKKKVKTCLSGLSSYRFVHLWRRFWEIIRQMTCIEPHKVAPLTAKTDAFASAVPLGWPSGTLYETFKWLENSFPALESIFDSGFLAQAA